MLATNRSQNLLTAASAGAVPQSHPAVKVCRGCSCPFREAGAAGDAVAAACADCGLVYCLRRSGDGLKLCKTAQKTFAASGGRHWCHCKAAPQGSCACQPCHKRAKRKIAAAAVAATATAAAGERKMSEEEEAVVVVERAAKRTRLAPQPVASLRVRAVAVASGARRVVALSTGSWSGVLLALQSGLELQDPVSLVTDATGFEYNDVAALRDGDELHVHVTAGAGACANQDFESDACMTDAELEALLGGASSLSAPATSTPATSTPATSTPATEAGGKIEKGEEGCCDLELESGLLETLEAIPASWLDDIASLLESAEVSSEPQMSTPTPPPLIPPRLAYLLRSLFSSKTAIPPAAVWRRLARARAEVGLRAPRRSMEVSH